MAESAPTPFQIACRRHLGKTWMLAAHAPSKLRRTQRAATKEQGLASRAGTGCLGWMLFGWIFFLLPLLFVGLVEAAILAYALVVTMVWLLAEVSAGISRVAGRPGASSS